jgi:cytochrome c peroxidase
MKLAGKSADLDALALYTNSFPVRLSPHKLDEAAERGRKIFESKSTNCASCHSGPYYSDSTLKTPFTLHDVGTGGDEREKMGNRFDTPTLLGVYRSGPYLHNGAAKTLHDVIRNNPGDKHGITSHLKANEVDDLVAFLKCLPFEPPPVKTPNTVKEFAILEYPRPKPGDGSLR